MLVVIVLVLSATVGVIVASSNGTRFNNTILASSVAAVSSSGLLTVTNQYQGIPGKTTKGEITTYIEKKTWGLFWKRVDIGEPNNEWYDVIYNYVYAVPAAIKRDISHHGCLCDIRFGWCSRHDYSNNQENVLGALPSIVWNAFQCEMIKQEDPTIGDRSLTPPCILAGTRQF